MLASQLITGSSELNSHSYSNTIRHFLNFPVEGLDKTDIFPETLDNECLDGLTLKWSYLLKLYEVQRVQLKDLQLLQIAKLEFDTVQAIAKMELAGIQLDVDRWRVLIQTIEEKHLALSSQLKKKLLPGSGQLSLFGENQINLDSPQQILEALRRMGLPIRSTRGWYLQQFADEYPVLEELLEYRGLNKLLTSYGANILKFVNPFTGRIHANFFQIGTPTSRLACHEPNLQQIPKSINYRQCFVAPPGRKLIVADYSQIELRILADMANDEVLIEAFNSGKDLHRITASQMFNIPIDSVTTVYREAAKRLNYGIVCVFRRKLGTNSERSWDSDSE